MTALEFVATMNPDGTVRIPDGLAAQLRAVQTFRVLVLVPDEGEDQAWEHLTESEFFRGYAPSDSIYDDV